VLGKQIFWKTFANLSAVLFLAEAINHRNSVLTVDMPLSNYSLSLSLQPNLDPRVPKSEILELVYHFTSSFEWDLKDVADRSFLALEAQQYAVSLQ